MLDFLTVVLLTYNRKGFASLALQAVLDQTYRDFKIIVIDNHSSDGTLDTLTKVAGDDERVTFMRLHHGSNAANSYMTGISAARSEFVLVTHDDDILAPTYLQKIVDVVKANPTVGMVACNAKLIDQSGAVVHDRLYDLDQDLVFGRHEYGVYYCENKFWLPTPTLCFRKKLHLDIFGHDIYPQVTDVAALTDGVVEQPAYKPSGDIEFCVKLNFAQSIYFIAEPQISYRQHPGQESRNVDASEPMLVTLNAMRQLYARRKADLARIENIFVKYKVQDLLFKSRLDELKMFLRDDSACTRSFFAGLTNLLVFGVKPTKAQMVGGGIYDGLMRLASTQKSAQGMIGSKPIVLVGSMLASFLLFHFLQRCGVKVEAVIDYSPVRQGQSLGACTIQSYEAFFEAAKDFDGTFVITSERHRDNSIVETIRRYSQKGDCVFWNDMVADLLARS